MHEVFPLCRGAWRTKYFFWLRRVRISGRSNRVRGGRQ